MVRCGEVPLKHLKHFAWPLPTIRKLWAGTNWRTCNIVSTNFIIALLLCNIFENSQQPTIPYIIQCNYILYLRFGPDRQWGTSRNELAWHVWKCDFVACSPLLRRHGHKWTFIWRGGVHVCSYLRKCFQWRETFRTQFPTIFQFFKVFSGGKRTRLVARSATCDGIPRMRKIRGFLVCLFIFDSIHPSGQSGCPVLTIHHQIMIKIGKHQCTKKIILEHIFFEFTHI